MCASKSIHGLRGDWDKLARMLSSLGWRIEHRTRHTFAFAPNGKDIVSLSGSNDPRALRNQKAKLRRLGVEV